MDKEVKKQIIIGWLKKLLDSFTQDPELWKYFHDQIKKRMKRGEKSILIFEITYHYGGDHYDNAFNPCSRILTQDEFDMIKIPKNIHINDFLDYYFNVPDENKFFQNCSFELRKNVYLDTLKIFLHVGSKFKVCDCCLTQYCSHNKQSSYQYYLQKIINCWPR